LTFLKVNFEVIGAMFRECFCFALAEDVGELVVFLQNTREVNQVSGQGCSFARECFLCKVELETLRAGDGLGDGLGTEGRILRFWKGAIAGAICDQSR
jgi:hypothetical protein